MDSATEIIVNSKVPTQNVHFTWRIEDFDIICPPGEQDFSSELSPEFIIPHEAGGHSIWNVAFFGEKGYLGLYINLIKFHDPSNPNADRKSEFSTLVDLALKDGEDTVIFKPARASFRCRERMSSGWRKLIELGQLLNRKSGTLNTLKIEIALAIRSGPMIFKHLKVKSHSSAQMITEQPGDEKVDEGENLILKLDSGHTFPVHKTVLSDHSKYFAKMFAPNSTGIQQSELHLEEVDKTSARAMVTFMYLGTLPDIPEDFDMAKTTDLLKVASKYEMEEFTHEILLALCENLSEDNYEKVIGLCDKFGQSETSVLLQLAAFNLGGMSQSPGETGEPDTKRRRAALN